MTMTDEQVSDALRRVSAGEDVELTFATVADRDAARELVKAGARRERMSLRTSATSRRTLVLMEGHTERVLRQLHQQQQQQPDA